jgi:hypothetical protein
MPDAQEASLNATCSLLRRLRHIGLDGADLAARPGRPDRRLESATWSRSVVRFGAELLQHHTRSLVPAGVPAASRLILLIT